MTKLDLADKAAERWEDWMERCSLAWVEIVRSESLHAPEELSDFLPDLDEPLDNRFVHTEPRVELLVDRLAMI
ncbi:hypothetical protein ACWDZ8_12170 [Streptomyces sp. NPDC003233]